MFAFNPDGRDDHKQRGLNPDQLAQLLPRLLDSYLTVLIEGDPS